MFEVQHDSPELVWRGPSGEEGRTGVKYNKYDAWAKQAAVVQV